MKNILIIGGSYFAGRVLVENLIRDKRYKIFVYNRGRIPLRQKAVTELVGDRNDEQRIREVIPAEEWHALIDFCAYTPEHIIRMIRSVPGRVGHYIFISTTTVYENTCDLPITENSPKLSAAQPELGEYADYGYNKWLAERTLKEECEKRRIPYTCLRPSIIYGRYNYAPRESYFFDIIRDNKPVIIPDNELAFFSFVWVVDMAKIILVTLGQILKYAVRHRYLDYNPLRDAERPRDRTDEGEQWQDKITVLNPEQIKAFLGVEEEKKYKMLFMLATFSGARQGELLGLKWGDIDWKNSQIHVQRTFNNVWHSRLKRKAQIEKLILALMFLLS